MHRTLLIPLTILALILLPHVAAARSGRLDVRLDPVKVSEERFDGLRISADHELIPGFPAEELAAPEAAMVGAWLVEANGAVILGLGQPARVARLHDGELETLYESEDEAVFALARARGRRGEILAGLGPSGRIVAIARNGKVRTLLETEAAYVWALTADGRGGWFAGLGAPGALLHIDAKGRILERLDLPVSHVLQILRRKQTIWFSTSDPGRIYRWKPGAGPPRVVHEAGSVEIHSLRATPDGGVVFAASTKQTIAALRAEDDGEAAPGEGGGFQETVTRLDPDGLPHPLWRSGEHLVYDLVVDRDRVLVACGDRGRLLAVDEAGDVELLQGPYDSAVLGLERIDKGLVFLLADPLRVMKLTRRPAPRGTFTSTALDAGAPARWGQLTLHKGSGITEVRVRTRSGHTPNPDPESDQWSEWTEAPFSVDGYTIQSPPARFLQLELTLTGQGEPPSLRTGVGVRDIAVSYRTANRAPRVLQVTVYPQRMGAFEARPPSMGKTFSQQLDSGIRIEYSINDATNQPGLSKGRWILIKGLRTVSASAEDPDGDQLVFSFNIRRFPDGPWQPLVQNNRERFYTFDTAPFADGRYIIEAVADDAPANPLGSNRTGRRSSALFTIDNTPPTIENARVRPQSGARAAAGVLAEFTVHDNLSRIERVEVNWDGETWWLAQPADGITDSRVEQYSIPIPPDDRAKGRPVLVRVRDENWNLTTFSIPRE
jgi:hypothetical protein